MGTTFSRSYTPSSGEIHTDNEEKLTQAQDETVEAVVCNQNDLQDNEMKVFDVGDHGKVLLVKQKGKFNAVGTKCTHYGAPLVTGALGNGRVRCPWHGACFNLNTGDIEDFPGFDSLPCYQVTVDQNGDVKVKGSIKDLALNVRVKNLGAAAPAGGNHVVIVGGGPSGATCAESLRSEGFRGRITMVAKENYLPYDRIKVSKIGTVTDIQKLEARSAEYYQDANITIIKGTTATKVVPKDKKVHLSDGTSLQYNYLYLATGSKPRVPDVPGMSLKNIYTVRNFDDSVNILTTLGDNKDKKVVVLGLSFIGLEVAASCSPKAKSVTVVGKDSAPLAQVFGPEIGNRLRALFVEKGVSFQFNTTITQCNGVHDEITSVDLDNGHTLHADILIMGVGTTFYTNFLEDSGISLEANGSVSVNKYLETSVKNIYAGGDIAFAPVFAANNEKMSIGHVGLAQYHGRVAALNILKKETALKTVPYFWTMLFGKSIRYAGYGKPATTLVDGNIDELKFVIFFFDASDKVIAVASCMRDPIVSQFAEFLFQGKTLYKKDLKGDPFAWTSKIN